MSKLNYTLRVVGFWTFAALLWSYILIMATRDYGYPVDVIARAYSPHDSTGENNITATGVSTDEVPFGIAAPPELFGAKVFADIKGFHPYENLSEFTVDDTGSHCKRRTRETGILHVEFRFLTSDEARRFGVRNIRIYLDRPWPVIQSKTKE